MDNYSLISNIKQLDDLKMQVDDDLISISDAYEILKYSKKKLYHSKYWKELRLSLIREKCENCGSSERLVLQHTEQPKLPNYLECFHNANGDKLQASKLQLIGFIHSWRNYLLCIHTKTLCNKCAFAEDFRDSTRMFCDIHQRWYYSKYQCDECKKIARKKKLESIGRVSYLIEQTYLLPPEKLTETANSIQDDEERYWYVVKMSAYKYRTVPGFEDLLS